MNKRIEKLIKQCTETSTHYVDGRGNITETYFNKEKFAELIIYDCYDVVKYAVKVGTPDYLVPDAIKQLFGIKE